MGYESLWRLVDLERPSSLWHEKQSGHRECDQGSSPKQSPEPPFGNRRYEFRHYRKTGLKKVPLSFRLEYPSAHVAVNVRGR